MKCSDCKGSGEYLPLIGLGEPCRLCKGRGELNDDGTAIDPKAKTLDSVFNANLPSWMEDHKDEINLQITTIKPSDIKHFSSTGRLDNSPYPSPRWGLIPGGQCFTKYPRPAVNDTLFVFDCDWYETTITLLYEDHSTNGSVMVRADYASGVFKIPEGDICWNVTQQRLECIKAGTPVWP